MHVSLRFTDIAQTTLVLELNNAGVQVAFIDNDDFLECLEKQELSKHWGLLRGIDLVIGRADLQ